MQFNEIELDLIESTGYFIKYLLNKPEVEPWEIYQGMRKLEEIGILMKERNIEDDKALEKFLPVDDMKELVQMFMDCIQEEFYKSNDPSLQTD